MLGRKHPATQPMHRGFERKAGPGGRLVEQTGKDSVLIVQRPAARHNSLHQPRTVEQFHQQRNGKLLRLNYVLHTRRLKVLVPCPASSRLLCCWHRAYRHTGTSSSSGKSVVSSSSASGMMCVLAPPVTASDKCACEVMMASLPPLPR